MKVLINGCATTKSEKIRRILSVIGFIAAEIAVCAFGYIFDDPDSSNHMMAAGSSPLWWIKGLSGYGLVTLLYSWYRNEGGYKEHWRPDWHKFEAITTPSDKAFKIFIFCMVLSVAQLIYSGLWHACWDSAVYYGDIPKSDVPWRIDSEYAAQLREIRLYGHVRHSRW